MVEDGNGVRGEVGEVLRERRRVVPVEDLDHLEPLGLGPFDGEVGPAPAGEGQLGRALVREDLADPLRLRDGRDEQDGFHQ